MSTCPICEREVQEETRQGRRVIPYHDFHPNVRALCAASDMAMDEAAELARARGWRKEPGA